MISARHLEYEIDGGSHRSRTPLRTSARGCSANAAKRGRQLVDQIEQPCRHAFGGRVRLTESARTRASARRSARSLAVGRRAARRSGAPPSARRRSLRDRPVERDLEPDRFASCLLVDAPALRGQSIIVSPLPVTESAAYCFMAGMTGLSSATVTRRCAPRVRTVTSSGVCACRTTFETSSDTRSETSSTSMSRALSAFVTKRRAAPALRRFRRKPQSIVDFDHGMRSLDGTRGLRPARCGPARCASTPSTPGSLAVARSSFAHSVMASRG